MSNEVQESTEQVETPNPMVAYSCRIHQEGHNTQEEADNCISNSMAGIHETEESRQPIQQRPSRPPKPTPPSVSMVHAKGGEQLVQAAQQMDSEARKRQQAEHEKSVAERLEFVNRIANAVLHEQLAPETANFISDHYFDPRPQFAATKRLVRRLLSLIPSTSHR